MNTISQSPNLVTIPLKYSAKPADPSKSDVRGAGDNFEKSDAQPAKPNWKNIGKLALYTLSFGALGVAAGLGTGALAAIAGGISGLAGGAVSGLLLGGYLGDKYGGGESPKVAGIALGTTLGVTVASAAAGIYVGAMVSHPLAAVGLGLLGAFGGFGRGILSLASQKPPEAIQK